MNIKRLLILGLILIAFSTTLSAISADGVNSTSTSVSLVNSDLTINGIHFKVPTGFEQVDQDQDIFASDDDKEVVDIDGTKVDDKASSEFTNNAGEKVEVTVGILANDKEIESINPAGFTQKTIADRGGYFKQDTVDGKNQVKFEYLEEGKLVKIEAPDEDMIAQIIGQ